MLTAALGLCVPSTFYYIIKHCDDGIPPLHKLVDGPHFMRNGHSQSAGESGYGDDPLLPDNQVDYVIAELLCFLSCVPGHFCPPFIEASIALAAAASAPSIKCL